jgi:hypothetical protein
MVMVLIRRAMDPDEEQQVPDEETEPKPEEN